MSHKLTQKVISGTVLTASSEPETMPISARKAPTRAAGAASTPKINCLEVENRPYMSIGKIDP